MQKTLRPENPVLAFMEKVFNMMLANVLFLICCIPVFTIGASLSGLLQVVEDQIYHEEEPVLRRFFGAFRENFRQSTAAFLMLLVFLTGMICNALLTLTYLRGWIAQMVYIFLGVLTALVLSIMSYFFPMIVRYRNTLKDHFNNSLILTIVKLPRTVVMLLLNTMFFWIPFFSFRIFLATLVFWLIIGFAFVAYSDIRILAPVFKQMEEKDTVELLN